MPRGGVLITALLLTTCCGVAQAWFGDFLPHAKCDATLAPGAPCLPRQAQEPSNARSSCCPAGYACWGDPASNLGPTCRQLPKGGLIYKKGIAWHGTCKAELQPGSQCGGGGGGCAAQGQGQCGNVGPWPGWCCPDGWGCEPSSFDFRIWTCVRLAARAPPPGELLQWPPRPVPRGACSCRVAVNGSRSGMDCPSPWDHPAGASQVPTPIRVGARGVFVSTESGAPVALRGVNWFGWELGSHNVDGLYAYCDDNNTDHEPPCRMDGEIPPHTPRPAIGKKGVEALDTKFWGKRTMTNDFAGVVYRMKLLGFNAVRLPFSFKDLNKDLPAPGSEFGACMRDDPSTIVERTTDPRLVTRLANRGGARFPAPPYTGMQHPPPRNASWPAACGLPWEAPLLRRFRRGREGGDDALRLTQCNWYLPHGEGVAAIHRFLWQVQYLVSQGFYVVLAFASTRDPEPNVSDPALLAANWHALLRALASLPNYSSRLRGRVLADLANEPSRWGCQWDRVCPVPQPVPDAATAAAAAIAAAKVAAAAADAADAAGAVAAAEEAQAAAEAAAAAAKAFHTLSCAPGVWLLAAAAGAVHSVDPSVPVLIEGMGQDLQRDKYSHCAASHYPGNNWGDGFITDAATLSAYGISDPSGMFATTGAAASGPGFMPLVAPQAAPPTQIALAPHVYPASITGAPAKSDDDQSAVAMRWDLSWGMKHLGSARGSRGEALRASGLIIGEFGVKDRGNNTDRNADTTRYTRRDRAWLKLLSDHLKDLEPMSGPISWLWWSWNANSGDTRGLVGPQTTWREVQWTKVRVLVGSFGLRPWYCSQVEARYCIDNVMWR
ncbi:glycoside hydrolase [Raphidocelis subcapitata]|uniref:Glycoside hydrolase n=1 Tax=Raphidocelis subcapitata TaxID=307507 RepID=A0A2V0NR36_9CHLO|nr:glycoside hydrolase [Raphidocelis subcapitata]|eukprot:GBF87397.1 glycoside hydrolase [Raphidocelis subcapitata]